MSSGGCDLPRPPSSRGDKGEGKVKKSRYEIRLRSLRATPVSTAPSPSAAPILSSSPTAPSPLSVPPRPANQPIYGPPGFIMIPTPGLQSCSVGDPSSSRVDGPPGHPAEHTPDSGGDSSSDGEDPPPGALPMIEPIGKGFHPCRTASKAVTKTIRQQFREPWISWGEIGKNDRRRFFNHFKTKVTWRPEHEAEIEKNFHAKSSHRLSEMFSEARKNSKKPRWMGDQVWNRLLEQWNSPAYRAKCEKAKKNRASEKGGSLHTGGSVSTHTHAVRMEEVLCRPVHPDEIFQQTHVRKDTGDFVDERSRRTHEDFETRLSLARSEAASCTAGSESSPLDPAEEERLRTRCWVEAAGGMKKGRIYGVGDLACGYRRGNISLTQAASSHSQDTPEMLEMRERLSAAELVAHQARQSHDELSRRFQSFVGTVLQFLPPDARAIVEREEGDQQQQGDHHEQQQDDHLEQQQDDQQQRDDPQHQQDQQQHDSPDYSSY